MGNDATNLILEHIKRRPEASPQDIYKLLYQGVFGVGHIISDRAWDILVEEADRIDLMEHGDDPLFEPVSPDGSMVRVNLRQYIRAGGNLEQLFRVMKESAEIEGDPAVFLGYWSQFKALVEKGELSFDSEDVSRLQERIEKDGVKPMHHSEAYRVAYYPAYRVVSRRVFNKIAGVMG